VHLLAIAGADDRRRKGKQAEKIERRRKSGECEGKSCSDFWQTFLRFVLFS
jgi:hypothetical protein